MTLNFLLSPFQATPLYIVTCLSSIIAALATAVCIWRERNWRRRIIHAGELQRGPSSIIRPCLDKTKTAKVIGGPFLHFLQLVVNMQSDDRCAKMRPPLLLLRHCLLARKIFSAKEG